MTKKTTSEASLNLPIVFGETIECVIEQLNQKYQLGLRAENYLERSVYLDQTGYLRIDLINNRSGQVEWIVKNHSGVHVGDDFVSEINYILHPKSLKYPEIMKNQSVFINTKQELAFLAELNSTEMYQSNLISFDKARQLMELLNQYKIGPGWSCNPNRASTTANFKLIYLGSVKEMSDEYKINPNGSYAAIVELIGETGPVVYSLTVG